MTGLGVFKLIQYDDEFFVYRFDTYQDERAHRYLVHFETIFPDFDFIWSGIGAIQENQDHFYIYTTWKDVISLKIKKVESGEIL